jgi:hypothetical protein
LNTSFEKRIGWEDIRQKKQRIKLRATFEERFPLTEWVPLLEMMQLIGPKRLVNPSGDLSDSLEDRDWKSEGSQITLSDSALWGKARLVATGDCEEC